MTTSLRRKVSCVFLGFFYGGSVVNGVERGIEFVLRSKAGLSEWPVVAALVGVTSAGLAAFLAAYSSQSLVTGLLSLASVLPLFLFSSGGRDLNVFAVIVAAATGVGLVFYGMRLPLPAGDVEKGRLFGVRWGHWLWLWLPWQYVVANAVWFAIPPSLLGKAKASIWDVGTDVIKTPLMLGLLAYSVVEAVNSIRQDAPWSRGQAALRFLGWFLFFPIVVNLMRLVGFL